VRIFYLPGEIIDNFEGENGFGAAELDCISQEKIKEAGMKASAT